MKIRKIFRANKNDGLKVTTAITIVQTPLPGSIFILKLLRPLKALKRLSKTFSATDYSTPTGAGWEVQS